MYAFVTAPVIQRAAVACIAAACLAGTSSCATKTSGSASVASSQVAPSGRQVAIATPDHPRDTNAGPTTPATPVDKHRPGQAGPTTVPSSSNVQNVLAARDAADALLAASYPDYFNHILVDQNFVMITVFRKPNALLDQAITALGRTRGVSVGFVDTRYSASEADRLVNQISSDRGFWSAQGVELSGITADDGIQSAVIVTTPAGSQQEQNWFDQRYGKGLVRIVKATT
jgi:hypothetical protein